MCPRDTCLDCDGTLERMTLQGEDAVRTPTIVSELDDDGFLDAVRAETVYRPVPYVCADYRRVLWYAVD